MDERYRRNERDWRDEDRHSQSYQQDDQRYQAGDDWNDDNDRSRQSNRGSRGRSAPMQQSYGRERQSGDGGRGRQGGDFGRNWQEEQSSRGSASFGRAGGMPSQRPADDDRWDGSRSHQDQYGGYSGGQQEAFSRYDENRGDQYGQGYGQSYGQSYGTSTNRSYGRDSLRDQGRNRGYDEDRGFLERASDEVMSWFGDDDAARRRRQDHRGRGPSDYKRSDERIREDANDRLTDDWQLDASNIRVKVSSGEITLDGTVDSRQAKRRAEDCVDRISGVKHVQNNLRVNEGSMFGTDSGSTASTGTSRSSGTATTGSTTSRSSASNKA